LKLAGLVGKDEVSVCCHNQNSVVHLRDSRLIYKLWWLNNMKKNNDILIFLSTQKLFDIHTYPMSKDLRM